MTTRDRSWLAALGSPTLLVLVFLLALPAVTHRLNASDEIEYFAWLRSATFDRDADFENEYRYFHERGAARSPGFHETFLERVNENGRRHNFAPIGSAILWAPFYGLAHLVAGWTGAPQDGFSAPYVTAVTSASAFYGLLALLLSAAIVQRVIGRGRAAVFAVWIGTPLLFYMYVAPGFAHAGSAFAVSLFLWTWLRVRSTWSTSGCVQLGLTAALLPMVREQDVFFVAGPACDFLATVLWPRRSTAGGDRGLTAGGALGAAAAGVIASVLAYAPQLYAYVVLNGHPGPDQTVSNKMNWLSPHFGEVLVSPAHGLFVWTPLAVVALVGLMRLVSGRVNAVAADARWIGFLAILMFGLQVYISGSVESWTVAGSFGQRRFVALTPLLALGLASLTRGVASYGRQGRHGEFPAWATLLVALCVWWNVGLMAQFGLHWMDRQRLDPRENARVTFVELPQRLPSIVWRYLTNRESFYRLPRQ